MLGPTRFTKTPLTPSMHDPRSAIRHAAGRNIAIVVRTEHRGWRMTISCFAAIADHHADVLLSTTSSRRGAGDPRAGAHSAGTGSFGREARLYVGVCGIDQSAQCCDIEAVARPHFHVAHSPTASFQ